MDISESYDPHQQQQQQIQSQEQQQQQQHPPQLVFPSVQPFPMNGFNDTTAPMQELVRRPVGAIEAPPPTPVSTEVDIDSCLLQQFSCLGTTDHEDLINQFQTLMNNQMNKESARFFLEMSNWNLQTAIGCFLDFCNMQTLPSMKIIAQSRPSELKQAWKLQNDGNEDWPNGCFLMSPNQTRKIEVPVIRPGDTCDIVADIPPTNPAIMWRLCTPNGWYFGETIWMIPPGTCDTAADLADRMAQLRTSNSMSPESFPQVNVVIMVNME
ncbi:protein ILRUN [Eupeodes corollae]|uniref:protein ILRUN n=1 Tax=Eupeodes corollae TaxID=290404 RepID=UPI002491E27A|nr:protein ILRUN [Eupeodes corollae]XP_055913776.1 protein ILRUN [Eupeodes corollae]